MRRATQAKKGQRMSILKDKVALVTGGSRGIGKAIALRFAEEGARVVINYTSGDAAAEDVLSRAGEKGLEVMSVKGSVSNAEDVRRLIAETKSAYSRIDILVNNAGIKKDGFLMVMKEKDWDEVIDVNLKGAYLCCREAVKTMVSQKNGRIINVSSVTGVVGQPGQTNYAASKGGLISFTKSLAKEVARFGISVNAIAPGFIQTDMLKDVPEDFLQESVKTIPLKRFGKVEEVADAALFLASDLSSYITGHVLQVDGGQAM